MQDSISRSIVIFSQASSLSAADFRFVILHKPVGRGIVPSEAYNLMSFAIPALHNAATESELARYADGFGHAGCFAAGDLDEIVGFIRNLAGDEAMQVAMSQNAAKASKNFRRGNADRFVESYVLPSGHH